MSSASVVVTRFSERDVDVLLAEEFQVSPAFADWFLSQLQCVDCQPGKVLRVEVSKSDRWGESDLVVLFESADAKSPLALFVEDKIDAPLQPDQLARYRRRAQNGQERGDYSHFHVVLCSPETYRKTHTEAAEFDACISFEAIAAFLRKSEPASVRNAYRADILANLARKLGRGRWVKETDPLTDKFWQCAYDIAQDFPDLEMREPKFASGTEWISFRPSGMPSQPIHMIVDLKASKGFADLTFSGILYQEFGPRIAHILKSDMTTHQAGRSSVIRLKTPMFRICEFDSVAEQNVRAAFTACTRLIRFYRKHRLALDAAASKSLPEPLAPAFFRHPVGGEAL